MLQLCSCVKLFKIGGHAFLPKYHQGWGPANGDIIPHNSNSSTLMLYLPPNL